MGTDIYGRIEVNIRGRREHYDDPWWRPIGRLDPLVGRSYDTFSCLFGVRGYMPFEPIAEGRGLPDDVSEETEEAIFDGAHSTTYLKQNEVDTVNWEETADGNDQRFSIVDEQGEVQAKAAWFGWMDDEFTDEEIRRMRNGERIPLETDDDGNRLFVDGSNGEQRYMTCREMTRGRALSEDWKWFLFDYLRTLGSRYGSQNVRIVVWFGS